MSQETSSSSSGTMVASAIVTALATICVALRFYTRIRTKAGIAWDDWWILIGLLTSLLIGGLLLWGSSTDPDAQSEVSEAIFTNTTDTFDTAPHTTYLKLSFISSILYFAIVTSIKVSILLMYRRIFSIDYSFHLQSLLLLAVIFAFWLAVTTATLLNCRPLKYSWIGMSWEEYCFNYNIFWMVTGAVEVIIDTAILALPVRMVLRLQLSQKRKISIMLIFLLGGFVIITGIIRVIYSYVPGSRVPEYIKAELWSTIHIGMAIFCACLPTIRPLFTGMTSRLAKASSSLRQRYCSASGRYSKDTAASSNSPVPRSEDAIEILSLSQQECHCGAYDLGGASADTFSSPGHYRECYCAASLKDPRAKTGSLEAG
ncbi:hypothetical protein EPUS_03684 [Endocarpon pusillum Z07020]|uniref:Rhodopsin domain-containing protein n=1 Tax=Endocarpon pusillum (strain Z07020 / HMAS-L-300199) TaxID=1263415 RepID=U1FXS4_ENDPU|nr:uncharacterized protein EPUS_03684 [Endocarpon pusillum Z07020]ERF69692.1 hypothetical protein EPUS_03684 [Endocarpon pusillum Z07020]